MNIEVKKSFINNKNIKYSSTQLDIIYAAERPIISLSRTLSEIIPLRTLIRDIQNNNIP